MITFCSRSCGIDTIVDIEGVADERHHDMKTKNERIELRRKAYELRAAGKTAYGIHKALGVSVQTASNWMKRFAERGEEGVLERKRGPETNPNVALPPEVRETLSCVIEAAAALGVGASDINRTRTFRRLARQACGTDLPPRSARRWMHRLGLPSGGHRPAAVPDRTTAETA